MLCNRTVSAALILSFVALAPQGAAAKTARQVDFRSADTPPTPLQLKRAEVQENPLGRPGDELTGFLRIPDGDGPFPAAVLLHGCEGVKAFQQEWAAHLTAQGYVTLLVDSFSARGQSDRICDEVSTEKRSKLVSGRVLDAFGALDYLAKQPFVAAASAQFTAENRSMNLGGELHAPLMLLLPDRND